MHSYTDARVKACVTTLLNTDATRLATIIAEMTTAKAAPCAPKAKTAKTVKTAVTIAPEAGIYADPSIAAGPAKATPRWHSERPSKSQIARNNAKLRTINSLESLLGLKPSDHRAWTPDGRNAYFTGKGYSDHCKRLNAGIASLEAEVLAAI